MDEGFVDMPGVTEFALSAFELFAEPGSEFQAPAPD